MVALKTPQEIELMRTAGQILKRIFQRLKTYVVPNKTTREIDD